MLAKQIQKIAVEGQWLHHVILAQTNEENQFFRRRPTASASFQSHADISIKSLTRRTQLIHPCPG